MIWGGESKLGNFISCAVRKGIINNPVPSAQYYVVASNQPWTNLVPQVKATIGLVGSSSAMRKSVSFTSVRKSHPVLVLCKSLGIDPSVEANICVPSKRREHKSWKLAWPIGRDLMMDSYRQPIG